MNVSYTHPFARAARMENSPSIDSRCTAPKGQLTGKAVFDSRARMASNILLRSMRQSRLVYISLMNLGCLQKSNRPCVQDTSSDQWCPTRVRVGFGQISNAYMQQSSKLVVP